MLFGHVACCEDGQVFGTLWAITSGPLRGWKRPGTRHTWTRLVEADHRPLDCRRPGEEPGIEIAG